MEQNTWIPNASISKWGPSMWRALHTITFSAPDTIDASEQEQYKHAFLLVSAVIPCHQCSSHLQTLYKARPPEVRTRREFVEWFIWIHNQVNIRLKKPTFSLPEVTALYLPEENWNLVLNTDPEKKEAKQYLGKLNQEARKKASHHQRRLPLKKQVWFWCFVTALVVVVILLILLVIMKAK